MYGYRTNQAILKAYMDWQLNKTPVDLTNKMPFNLLYINANIILKKKFKNLDYVRNTVMHLHFEEYFELDDLRNDKDEVTGLLVHMTKKGTSAYTGNVFAIKQDEVFWKRFIDIAITVANIIVAITAAWAIYNGSAELQELRNRLKLLEEQVQQSKITTNPKNDRLQLFPQTNQKADAKTNRKDTATLTDTTPHCWSKYKESIAGASFVE